jgi:hypothetical protein
MVLFLKKLFQGSRRSLNVKLLVTLVIAVCLGVAFLTITPTHAAPQKISGGGCTGGNDLKVCIHANKGKVTSEVTVNKSTSKPALIPECPASVTLKLFDNSGQIASTLVGRGCGHFNGPAVSIKSGDTYVAQVSVCFSKDPADCAAVPSPSLKVS